MRKIITYALLPVVVPLIIVGVIGMFISDSVDWTIDRLVRWKERL